MPDSLASWVGVAVGVGALIFAWLAWRVSRKELRLVQEEAELRPNLVISYKKAAYHYRPPNPGTQYPQAAVVFNITNAGRSAAHNVHCEVRLDESRLVLSDMHGKNSDHLWRYLGPTDTKQHQINVGVITPGPTEARYRIVCDKLGESEGTIKFEVPEWTPEMSERA